MTTQPTVEQLERVVEAALKGGDIQSVGMALRVMVTVDPRRAADLYDVLRVGVMIAEAIEP